MLETTTAQSYRKLNSFIQFYTKYKTKRTSATLCHISMPDIFAFFKWIFTIFANDIVQNNKYL